MENPEVAQMFEEVADLLDIQGENPFRVRAYRNAARTIRDLSEPLVEDAGGEAGRAVRHRQRPGRQDPNDSRNRRSAAPQGASQAGSVGPAGPAHAFPTWDRSGHRSSTSSSAVRSVDELRQAAEEHRIRALKGFGAKMEEKILQCLQGREESGRRVYLSEAKVFADALVGHLKQTPGVGQVEVAGSFRRHKETVGDLDLLVSCRRANTVMDRLADYEATAEVLARGKTKMTVRLRNGLQIDLRVVPEESYGAALQYFTGSKEHNILLRRRAQQRGLKISEYGVFRGKKQIAGRTEEEVYKAVGLPWIPPELREARGEIEEALEGRLPKLLELDDIRGDLHMHTTATDGRASLEEMVEAAKKRGYAYIAITDHSKRVTMAKGLDARRLRQQWKEIDRLAGTMQGITILKGVELDILEDGRLDLPDDVLTEADWVVASIHYGQKQPREQITAPAARTPSATRMSTRSATPPAG